MTRIEVASLNLQKILWANVAPDSVAKAQQSEWPVKIFVDNEEDAQKLSDALNELNQAFKEQGISYDED